MLKFDFTVRDEAGLHARPAGLLVKCAKGLSSSIFVEKDGKAADAKRLLAVMGLVAKQNDRITFTVTGENEQEDCAALQAFCENNI